MKLAHDCADSLSFMFSVDQSELRLVTNSRCLADGRADSWPPSWQNQWGKKGSKNNFFFHREKLSFLNLIESI